MNRGAAGGKMDMSAGRANDGHGCTRGSCWTGVRGWGGEGAGRGNDNQGCRRPGCEQVYLLFQKGQQAAQSN